MRQPQADVLHLADGLAEVDRVTDAVLVLHHDEQAGQVVGDQALRAETDRQADHSGTGQQRAERDAHLVQHHATPTMNSTMVTALLRTEPIVRARCSRRSRARVRSRCEYGGPRPDRRGRPRSASPADGSSTRWTTRVMARLATTRTTSRTTTMSAMRSGIPISAVVWSPIQPDHEAANCGSVAGAVGGEVCDIGSSAPFLGDYVSAVGAAYPRTTRTRLPGTLRHAGSHFARLPLMSVGCVHLHLGAGPSPGPARHPEESSTAEGPAAWLPLPSYCCPEWGCCCSP